MAGKRYLRYRELEFDKRHSTFYDKTKSIEAMGIFDTSLELVEYLLKYNLSKDFKFHSFEHTGDVVSATKMIAAHQDVDADLQEDLLLAACFHDTGYIITYEGHEKASIEVASDFLKNHHFPNEKIERVSTLIEATRYDRAPQTLAEQIIKDADTVHLSKPNYFEYLLRLRSEWQLILGKIYSDKEWLLLNLNFLNEHTYFTQYAIENWQKKKESNLGFTENMSKMITLFEPYHANAISAEEGENRGLKAIGE